MLNLRLFALVLFLANLVLAVAIGQPVFIVVAALLVLAGAYDAWRVAAASRPPTRGDRRA